VATSLKPPELMHKPKRADGAASRETIVLAALKLFADQGFTNTSTRQIAEAAGANISAIAYYFGDKQGLYRAAFCEPMGGDHTVAAAVPPNVVDLSMPLEAALKFFIDDMLAPLKQGEVIQDCIRLHFREFIEPTGVWDDEVQNGIKPQHDALLRYLCKTMGCKRPDVDLQRLVFAIVGMVIHLYVCREMINAFEPRMLATSKAIDQASDRFVMYALAMVAAEQARRANH
jgi:TetR/AcrR family transcriptional regulator, regulator of cefoperazone and chloramphenicol sensitivity